MVVFSFPEDGKSTPKYNGACTYLIVSPDGTPYVGQAQKFRDRMNKHKSDGKLAWINHAKHQEGKHAKVCTISFAINKHGWENMEIIILEKYVVWDQFLLDKREQCLIRFYDSFKNGYNSNEGGNGGGHPHTAEAKARMSASKMGNTNAPTKPVTSCKIKEEYADGTQLVEFVSYASAAEAAKKTGVGKTDISKCCLKKRESAGGRYWFLTEENHPPQIIKVGTIRVPRIGDKPRPSTRKRKLFSTSPEGEKQLHEGAAAAGRTLSALTGNKFEQSSITMCCSSKYKRTHHHGYTFYFASDEEIAEFNKEASKKRKRK